MSVRSLPAPILVVTDRHGSARSLAATVAACLDGGARWVWFRDRDLSVSERRALAEVLAARVATAAGVLTIGGDAGLAAAIGAGGVHLPAGSGRAAIAAARARLGANGLVGVSAHASREAVAAAEDGADYVTLSPVFPSASKPGYGPALGVDAVARAVRIGLPVVALGGVDAGNAAACRDAGAAGIAVMGGLMRATDPARAMRTILSAWAGTGRSASRS